MRFSVATALAACCASAQAFSDSTSFVLFSTAKFVEPDSSRQTQSSNQVVSSAKNILSSCPTERYLLVTQPNLNAGHLRDATGVPRLRNALKKAKSSFSIAEVDGHLDVKQLADYINEVCSGKAVVVDEVPLTALPADSNTVLAENDKNFGMIIDQYDMAGDYTVLYTAGSRTEEVLGYTPEFLDSMRTELKRQVHATRKNNSDFDKLPLFEKYQFFSPAIFMGLFAVLILVSILYIGVSAVGSLKVPYGAFEKEMGPSAQQQKKQ